MKQYAKQILTLCLVASLLGNAYLYSEVSGASKANLELSEQTTSLSAELTSLKELSAKQGSESEQLEKEIAELKKQVEENAQKALATVGVGTGTTTPTPTDPVKPPVKDPVTPPKKDPVYGKDIYDPIPSYPKPNDGKTYDWWMGEGWVERGPQALPDEDLTGKITGSPTKPASPNFG